jgi:hypothetical protein
MVSFWVRKTYLLSPLTWDEPTDYEQSKGPQFSRNPQSFVANIYKASDADRIKATQKMGRDIFTFSAGRTL